MTVAPRDFCLHEKLAAGETVYTIWSSVPEPGLVEALSGGPIGSVTLDMQHGGHHVESVLSCLPPVIAKGKAAIVRIPLGRFDMASRALDMGADAVIAPMINSLDDARAFRDSVKYPPLGKRSWGVSRALALREIEGGTAYLKSANTKTLSFAMIETREAYGLVEEIAAMEGIDGLFVGPADFSIAWSGGAVVDSALDDMQEAIARIAQVARDAGKHAGIFAVAPAMVPRYREMGFRFISIAFDLTLISEGQKAVLAAAGNGPDSGTPEGGY
jgi:4-hydroxy-2-oxoheptanedioate aldolase